MIHLFGPTKAEIADYERIYGNAGAREDAILQGMKDAARLADYKEECDTCGSKTRIEPEHFVKFEERGLERTLDRIESRTVEKCAKKIRKAQSLAEYKCVVDQLFAECELLDHGPKKWNLPQK